MNCRSCGDLLTSEILNLGFAPPSNSYLSQDQLSKPEKHFPLRILACETCWLVQTADFLAPEELFTATYAYLSSTSDSWLLHSQKFVQDISAEMNLNLESFVVEIASNDGYLLQYFKDAGVPHLGVEPALGPAEIARSKGIETLCEFFGESLAIEISTNRGKADLIIGINVFAHVPNLNDFTAGLARLLTEKGTISLEFPHLLNLIKGNQFDTVYHEHFSYLSIGSVKKLLSRHSLEIYEVINLKTHGGSVRINIGHSGVHPVSKSVGNVIQEETSAGLFRIEALSSLQEGAVTAKHNLLTFLLDSKRLGKTVIGLGAAAKGNTFLNFAGITSDLLPFVSDGAKSKQGMLLPGSHIPIVSPEEVLDMHIDIGIIFPWNLYAELSAQYKALLGPDVDLIPANYFLEM